MDGAARVGFPGAYPIVTSAVKSHCWAVQSKQPAVSSKRFGARRHSKTAPRKTRPHKMKLTSSGSGSSIGTSKKRSGSGWVITSPSQAKKQPRPCSRFSNPASEHRPDLAIFNFAVSLPSFQLRRYDNQQPTGEAAAFPVSDSSQSFGSFLPFGKSISQPLHH
jgi:hypothetical protein